MPHARPRRYLAGVKDKVGTAWFMAATVSGTNMKPALVPVRAADLHNPDA